MDSISEATRLKNALRLLRELSNTVGTNNKIDFVKNHKDDKDFTTLLYMRFNPFYTYGIKKLDVTAKMCDEHLGYTEFIDLLLKLNSSNINAQLRAEVENALRRSTEEDLPILIGLVTKSLSLGIGSGINKALGTPLVPAFDCMLAHPLEDDISLTMPRIVQRKYDGVRCLGIITNGVCKLYTRQGRLIELPLIEKELVRLSNNFDYTFDMELETESRTGISGIINSNLKTGYDSITAPLIRAKVFDVLPTATFTEQTKSDKQVDRLTLLNKLFLIAGTLYSIEQADSELVFSLDKLKEISKATIDAGYEGIIIKDPQAPYHFKRSKAWLKTKAINSATLKIVGVTEGKGKRAGKIGALVCSSACGLLSVDVGSGLTDDDVNLFSDVSPIGKCVEVVFNVVIHGSVPGTYSLFLPRFKEIRVDKDEADTVKTILENHIGKAEL